MLQSWETHTRISFAIDHHGQNNYSRRCIISLGPSPTRTIAQVFPACFSVAVLSAFDSRWFSYQHSIQLVLHADPKQRAISTTVHMPRAYASRSDPIGHLGTYMAHCGSRGRTTSRIALGSGGGEPERPEQLNKRTSHQQRSLRKPRPFF